MSKEKQRPMCERVAESVAKSLAASNEDLHEGWGYVDAETDVQSVRFEGGFIVMECLRNDCIYELRLKPHSWTKR